MAIRQKMRAKVFAAGSSLLSGDIDLLYCIPHNVGKEFESRSADRYQHSCRSGEGRAVDGGFFGEIFFCPLSERAS
jgi:hypothetical protein